MMVVRLPRALIRILPASLGGVVLGHVFLYRFLFPDSGHRHDVLHQTGHGYMPLLAVAGAVLLLMSVLMFLRSGRDAKNERLPLLNGLLVLFTVQAAVFVGMEFSERLLSEGLEMALGIFSSPLISYGLAFQLITATLLALLIAGAEYLGLVLSRTENAVLPPRLLTGFVQSVKVCANVDFLSIRAPPANPYYLS